MNNLIEERIQSIMFHEMTIAGCKRQLPLCKITDDLYMNISKHAIDMAEKLKKMFTEKGYEFFLDSPTNQQFIILENQEIEQLKEKVEFSCWEKYDNTHTVVRFATSWSTTEEELEYLRGLLKK